MKNIQIIDIGPAHLGLEHFLQKAQVQSEPEPTVVATEQTPGMRIQMAKEKSVDSPDNHNTQCKINNPASCGIIYFENRLINHPFINDEIHYETN